MSHRILVVDDDPHIREVAAMSLELVGGYEVLQATDGEQALAMAVSGSPDAILLDVMMPEMDGPTTLRRLKESPATKGIPVVFLTAKMQLSERARLADLEVVALIAKPFDPMALHNEVATALGWSG